MSYVTKVSPVLSVCIPTYNRSIWLENTLKAAWNEVESSIGCAELVVSDNASPDNSRELIERYTGNPMFVPVFQHENVGPVRNMHDLVTKHARGTYVWLIGDDDFIVPGAIGRILQCIKEHAEISFFFANYFRWMPSHEGAVPDFADLRLTERYGSARNDDFEVSKIVDLVGCDIHCFTPIYGSIVRRDLAATMYSRGLGETYGNLLSLYPQALFVAEEMLQRPGFHIGYPCVFASEMISWSAVAPLVAIKLYPDLLDSFEFNGAPKKQLDTIRKDVLAKSPHYAVRLLLQKPHSLVNLRQLFGFYWRYRSLPKVGKTIIKTVIFLLIDILPKQLTGLLRGMKRRMSA